MSYKFELTFRRCVSAGIDWFLFGHLALLPRYFSRQWLWWDNWFQLSVLIAYFCIIPLLNNNGTIGMRLLKLKFNFKRSARPLWLLLRLILFLVYVGVIYVTSSYLLLMLNFGNIFLNLEKLVFIYLIITGLSTYTSPTCNIYDYFSSIKIIKR